MARADEPSAVRQDAAALVGLEGLQMQAGLDFQVYDVTYVSPSTTDRSAHHEIQFPPELYLTWKPAGDARWAVGIGIDSPMWQLTQWQTTFAADRSSIKNRLVLFEVRPAFAWKLDRHWSVGAALRYVDGTREHSIVNVVPLDPAMSPGFTTPVVTRAQSTVDGTGWALAARYAEAGWGAALQWSSHVKLDGNGRLAYESLTFPTAEIVDFDGRFPALAIRQSFELPDQIALGAWRALGSRTRLEVDAEYQKWSVVDATGVQSSAGPLAAFARQRSWKDVWALRAGAEHTFGNGWRAAAGVALEPSPVPDHTREFGFPFTDGRVIAIGGGYDFATLSFDGGWSFHDHAAADSGGPAVTADSGSRFRGHGQVFSISARWRFGSAAGRE